MHSAKRQRITFGFLCALLLLTNLQAIAQSGKFELDEFDNFIKTLNRGDFKTEDTDFLFRTFKEKYSQEVLSTIDTDLNSFVEDTLKDSGYLDSAGIFLRQLGTLISDEQSKKIDEYVEKQLNRFQDKYRYDEKLSVLFADEAILSNLKSQFKTQLKSRFEAIKTSFRDELKRSFPYAADMVVKSHDSLNVDVELKIVEELKKIKILASTGRTAAAGVTLVLLRKAITKLILRVIGKKIAASIAGKILGKAIPIVGWVLTAYDLLTAERQLLTTFKDEYSKHFHSHDFQREIFDQSLKSFEDDAKETYKSSIEAFISSISVKESNRLTGLIIQSKSPDADAYFPNYDNNDRARNVIDTVVRVYGADPEWAKYKMSEKFEISQSIGLENENAFIGLLKTNRDKFYKACEQRVNIVRDLLTIKEEGIIRYCLEFSDPLPVFEDIAYLYDKLGSQMAGKLDFVKFLIDSKGIAELKRHNLPRESVLPLAENYQAIQELYKTNQDAGAFMFLVAAKDKEMLALRCFMWVDQNSTALR